MMSDKYRSAGQSLRVCRLETLWSVWNIFKSSADALKVLPGLLEVEACNWITSQEQINPLAVPRGDERAEISMK